MNLIIANNCFREIAKNYIDTNIYQISIIGDSFKFRFAVVNDLTKAVTFIKSYDISDIRLADMDMLRDDLIKEFSEKFPRTMPASKSHDYNWWDDYAYNEEGPLQFLIPNYKIERFKNKISELNAEIKSLREGFEGSCHTCEPVALQNIKLVEKLKEKEALEGLKSIKFKDRDLGELTIKDFLKEILITFIREGECFSSKRPFGNSDWDGSVAEALINAGQIGGSVDEDGYLDRVDWKELKEKLIEIARTL